MKEIIDRYNKIKDLKNNLSEIDIQTLLIEPILSHGGWNLLDPNEVKRAGRSKTGKEFDIEVYNPLDHELKIILIGGTIIKTALNLEEIIKKRIQIKEEFKKINWIRIKV